MAYTLRTGEMLAVMHEAEMTIEAQHFQTLLETIGTMMAHALSLKFGMGYTAATYDLGMVAAAFLPNADCRELPQAMKDMGFDNAEEWDAAE